MKRLLIILLLISLTADGQTAKYVEIPYWFVQLMEGQKKGINIFNAIQSVQGDWFVSPETITDFRTNFQQLFDSGWTADTSTMNTSDFRLDTTHRPPIAQ